MGSVFAGMQMDAAILIAFQLVHHAVDFDTRIADAVHNRANERPMMAPVALIVR